MRRYLRLAVFALLLLPASSAQAQTGIAGDWQGTLSAGDVSLRIALHVTAGADGALTGTLDSLDQGATGIPVTAVAFKAPTLTFTVPAVQGSYEGKLAADGSAIEGTWTQMQPMPLTFRRQTKAETPPPAPAAAPSAIDGDWEGPLAIGGKQLRIVFHVVNRTTGLTATMDSPDQGAKGITVTTATLSGSTVRFEAKPIGGTYDGTLDATKSVITGTWSQGPVKEPLVLKRTKPAVK